ncbi:MAG: cupredoxin domain-containing protein [Lysobacterales bacterium]
MPYRCRLLMLTLLSLAPFAPSLAAEPLEVTVVIREHRFEPAEIKVPAGQKVKLIIDNQDASAEEFESYELNREKIVGANSRITVWVGPLKAGRYPFFGEFHQDTAQGVLIAE